MVRQVALPAIPIAVEDLAQIQSGISLEVYRAVIGCQDVTPGMVAAIHTFGQLVHHHPHIHQTELLQREAAEQIA